MKVLVTGGLGYIGSHTVVELYENGDEVVIIDNLYNSKEETLGKLETIVGKKIKFYKGDLCDKELVRNIFKENEIDSVIHFAGFKCVPESVQLPLKYYRNNLDTTITLLEVMDEFNVRKIVFSSSATVYGTPEILPLTENCVVGGTTNPYGTTKYFIERIMEDLYLSNNNWDITLLRYFNPVGAHKSGLIGENPNGIPNNLMPYVFKVASGELECLNITGNDYDTVDGTGVRDYIHVVDLAYGHVLALKNNKHDEVKIYNLGTGKGTSVLEIVNMFEKVNNITINKRFAPRRVGDIATCYADTKKAKEELGFETKYTLEDMCRDGYNYVLKNK